jgi:hypothetical protein
MTVYVELFIHADLDDLWRVTQTPELHTRWDLRFTEIRYLPRPDPSAPQRFLYETRLGFGLRIEGEGETIATREETGGARTSSLRFWSDDAKSLIRVGSGYWQYIPEAGGVRFLTRYQYETRFGLIGRVLNTALFEPLLGWATAWSFDRLRLWLEDGLDPGVAFSQAAFHAVAAVALACALTHPLIGLTLSAARTSPRLFRAPFNPAILNLSVAALGVIGCMVGRHRPSASSCLRQPRAPRSR